MRKKVIGKEMTQQAKSGDTVKVHYTGTLQDGTVFDSSHEREPLEFTLGEQQVIPGFETVITGMQVGESAKETIPAANAYGDRRDDMLLEVERSQFPEDVDPEMGMQLQIQVQDGSRLPVEIVSVEGDVITLDANHPLAGKDLVFEVELIEIAS
jgi:peptidylprolyl isomerase